MTKPVKTVSVLIISDRGPVLVDGNAHERGEIVETSDGEAQRLVHNSFAVVVNGDPAAFRAAYFASTRR